VFLVTIMGILGNKKQNWRFPSNACAKSVKDLVSKTWGKTVRTKGQKPPEWTPKPGTGKVWQLAQEGDRMVSTQDWDSSHK
jgi:hypothetical protein